MLVGATEMPNDGSRIGQRKWLLRKLHSKGVEVAAREDYPMDGPPIRLQAKICGWGMNLEVRVTATTCSYEIVLQNNLP